jgi:aryl-alcohol dehydrogenase-like predicted oxidoreductase
MSYGEAAWAAWVLGEEGMEHVKAAYDAGINTFDTANVYSNGLSEVILGKAIKKWNLPRDEIVVMTKVCTRPSCRIGELLLKLIIRSSFSLENPAKSSCILESLMKGGRRTSMV